MLAELTKFWQVRQIEEDPIPSFKPKLDRKNDPIAKKKEFIKLLAESGQRLNVLTNQDGWKDLTDVKVYMLALYDKILRSPTSSDKERFQAACERYGIERFFVELQSRITEGKKAMDALA